MLEGVGCDVILRYWTPRPGHVSVLSAEWWLPNENRGTTLFIRSGSLPVEELKPARVQLEEAVLPQIRAWVSAVINLPPSSPQLAARPRFSATRDDGILQVSHKP